MPIKRPHWTVYLMVALGVLGFLGGLTVPTLRWAFNVEQRLHDIERENLYMRGTIVVPEDK